MQDSPAAGNIKGSSVLQLLSATNTPPKGVAGLFGMQRPKGVTVRAYAKINLYLHVVGKRADGYHLLDSLIGFVGVADTLRVRMAQHYHLITDGAFANALPNSEENILTQTIHLLAERYKRKPHIFIELSKQLPVRTGFGSSAVDAAAAIRALQQIWGFKWSEDDFAFWANKIGADVPIAVYQQPAFISGIGEVIEPASGMPALHVLLARPDGEISSREVFSRYTYNGERALQPRQIPQGTDAFISWLHEKTNNDLMMTVAAMSPKSLRCYRAIVKQPDCLLARLSGAGPGCFGLFATAEQAAAAARQIKQEYPQWWLRSAPLLLSQPVN